MKVILSTELEDNYNSFMVLRSYNEVRNINGVDVVIVHKCEGISDFDAGVFISEFYSSGIKSFLYINDKPSKVLKMVITGVGGLVYPDEFYFEDEDELNGLLEDLGMGTETNSLALTSTQVVRDFIGAFSRQEERIQAPVYLEQVKQAINELSTMVHIQDLQIKEMGVSALDVFNSANTIITSMNEQKKLLEKKLNEFEETIVTSRPTKHSSFTSEIMFFPSYNHRGSTKVLNIRELSPCRYLTSFILAYTHRLHFELNKRVKLIFVHQKGKGVADKYSDFATITQESMHFNSIYDNEIIATNSPKKDVMSKLLSSNNDIIIVVDRLYSSSDIVTGKVIKVNAVSGFSDLKRFNVKANNCIFPITSQANELFSIPLIKNYPKEPDTRHAIYSQTCKDQFSILDNLLGINS